MASPFEDIGFDPNKLGNEATQKKNIRKKLLGTLKRAAGQIPFAEDVVAGYFCAKDTATPLRVRAATYAALAYFVMPLDVIPDFLVGIGYGDDLTILMSALSLLSSHITDEHRKSARKALDYNDLEHPDL